jgi:hypothetical protein
MRSKERPGSTRFPSWKRERSFSSSTIACANAISSALSGPEFLKEILAPLLGDRVVFHIPLVDDPQTKVRVLLRKMVAQFLNLFSWGRVEFASHFRPVGLRLIEKMNGEVPKYLTIQSLQCSRPFWVLKHLDALKFLCKRNGKSGVPASGRSSERDRCGRRQARKVAPEQESHDVHTRSQSS